MLLEQGVIRDTELSPELLQTSKDIADQMFLKLLRKEFREGSYYRTIIARFDTGAQASPAAQHALLPGGNSTGRRGAGAPAGNKVRAAFSLCLCLSLSLSLCQSICLSRCSSLFAAARVHASDLTRHAARPPRLRARGPRPA